MFSEVAQSGPLMVRPPGVLAFLLVALLVAGPLAASAGASSAPVRAELALGATALSPGDVLEAHLTVTNLASSSQRLQQVAATATPEGAGAISLGSLANVRLAPGESRTFTFTRTMSASDTAGEWRVEGSARLSPKLTVWSETRTFTVAAAAPSPAPAPSLEPSPETAPTPAPSGAGRVEATPQGLLLDGKPFLVKGVAYSPTPVGKVFFDHDFYEDKAQYEHDLPRIREMGANTVRVYYLASWKPDLARAFLDEAHRNDLKVIVGDWGIWEQDARDRNVQTATRERVLGMVTQFKDHPAVLMWSIGNEVELNYAGKDVRDWYRFLNTLAVEMKAIDPNHPVGTASSGAEHFRHFPSLCPDVDVYGLNLYAFAPGEITDYWVPLANSKLAGKPVLVSEFGSDAWDTHRQAEYEQVQAHQYTQQWKQIHADATTGTRKLAGGVAFEWVDGWWKSGDPWNHDGAIDWTNEGAKQYLPDGGVSEEYLGLHRLIPGSIEREPRAAFFALRDAWKA